MAHSFNRDDGTFAQVNYTDLTGSPVGGNTFTTTHTVLVSENTTTFGYISSGNSGFLLTSNGPGADPTFQAASGGVTFTTTHAVLLSETPTTFGYASPQSAGRLLTDNGAGADPTFQGFTTSHAVLLSSSTGFAYVTPATSGFVLTAQGAGNSPTFQAIPGGAASTPAFITSYTAASVASLSDTVSLTNVSYTNFELIFIDIRASTPATLELQVHGGGTFKTTGYLGATISTTSGASGVANATTFVQCSRAATVQVGSGVFGRLTIFNPAAGNIALCRGTFGHADGTVFCNVDTAGAWNTAGVIDGFRIQFSAGIINSGTLQIYGWP